MAALIWPRSSRVTHTVISVSDLLLLSVYAFAYLFCHRYVNYPHLVAVTNVMLIHVHICVWVSGYLCACVEARG